MGTCMAFNAILYVYTHNGHVVRSYVIDACWHMHDVPYTILCMYVAMLLYAYCHVISYVIDEYVGICMAFHAILYMYVAMLLYAYCHVVDVCWHMHAVR